MESVTLIFDFSLFLSCLFFVLFVSYSIIHVELIDYCVLRGLKEEKKKIWIIFSVINSESCFCLLYRVRVKVLILYLKCFSFVVQNDVWNTTRCKRKGLLITLVAHFKLLHDQSALMSAAHCPWNRTSRPGSHCVLEEWWFPPQSSRTPGPRLTAGTALPPFNL